MKIFYKTQATSVGGRTGRVALDDGSLAFDLVSPNSENKGVNPEQLFALGYAACFDSALNLLAKNKGLPLQQSTTSAEIGIGQDIGGVYRLAGKITVHIKGLTQEQAQDLVERAHQVCPYSNAIRGNVEVQLDVVVE